MLKDVKLHLAYESWNLLPVSSLNNLLVLLHDSLADWPILWTHVALCVAPGQCIGSWFVGSIDKNKKTNHCEQHSLMILSTATNQRWNGESCSFFGNKAKLNTFLEHIYIIMVHSKRTNLYKTLKDVKLQLKVLVYLVLLLVLPDWPKQMDLCCYMCCPQAVHRQLVYRTRGWGDW